jgi:hypothetical protein
MVFYLRRKAIEIDCHRSTDLKSEPPYVGSYDLNRLAPRRSRSVPRRRTLPPAVGDISPLYFGSSILLPSIAVSCQCALRRVMVTDWLALV